MRGAGQSLSKIAALLASGNCLLLDLDFDVIDCRYLQILVHTKQNPFLQNFLQLVSALLEGRSV